MDINPKKSSDNRNSNRTDYAKNTQINVTHIPVKKQNGRNRVCLSSFFDQMTSLTLLQNIIRPNEEQLRPQLLINYSMQVIHVEKTAQLVVCSFKWYSCIN